MKDALISLFYIFAVFLISALIVVGLAQFADPRPNRSTTDDYKDECVRLGGKPLWNGRHIECLKGSKT